MKPSISFTILGTVGLLRIHEYANIPNKDADIDPPPSLSLTGRQRQNAGKVHSEQIWIMRYYIYAGTPAELRIIL